MPSESRLHSERVFHDRQAQDRARTLRPVDLRFDDASYLDHESWIAPALAALGDVRGQRVLDLGCGHGMAAVVLARRGARVVACDLSTEYLREARARARANDVEIAHVATLGEALPFADGTFECIWGNAILHHLEWPMAARELARVLAPGGRGVFCEPWGENRWLSWARRHLPYPGKQRTPDEAPLAAYHVAELRRWFPRVELRGHQLLAMARRLLRGASVGVGLHWLDHRLLAACPHLERYCRYAVITLGK
jgi:ubiquinone/menaquinone biosynthesis C-methylase UbiE